MKHSKFNTVHIQGRIIMLENLSKEYMESIAGYENTKTYNSAMQPQAQEIDAYDEMFSDCIYLY
jgi:hypothetical protein